MTKFLLDSGDPEEYRAIAKLCKENRTELWGSTTNPTLIAKKLMNKKYTPKEAFELQRDIVIEITSIVPGAVSAEVYADKNTTASEMIQQGKEISTWHDRVVVKLPTTIEGFKARTQLRKNGILTNNTLVFSQEQIFAICLHENIIQKLYGPIQSKWPPFISPFVGRFDDIGINGMDLVKHGMTIKKLFEHPLWMLEASVRTIDHVKKGIELGVEILTAPAKTYLDWFEDESKKTENPNSSLLLKPISFWQYQQTFLNIKSLDAFMELIISGKLNIQHDLTDKGLERFAADWNAIIA